MDSINDKKQIIYYLFLFKRENFDDMVLRSIYSIQSIDKGSLKFHNFLQ